VRQPGAVTNGPANFTNEETAYLLQLAAMATAELMAPQMNQEMLQRSMQVLAEANSHANAQVREPSLTDMATPVRSHSWTRMSAEHVRRPYQQMMSCEISSTCVRWERWLGWSSSLGRDTVSLSLTVVAHSHS
jgi:hypothetical protein